jgi:hypothetical protein
MANKIRAAILECQRAQNIPDFVMCDILCMTESDWYKYKNGRGFGLTTRQKIMFVIGTETALPI